MTTNIKKDLEKAKASPSKKKVNYTEEETKKVIALWGDGNQMTIDEVVKQMGGKWSKASIIGKLSREKRYTAKPKTKSGKKAVKKEDLARELGIIAGLPDNDTSSLATPTKSALLGLLAAFKARDDTLAEYEQDQDSEDLNNGVTS